MRKKDIVYCVINKKSGEVKYSFRTWLEANGVCKLLNGFGRANIVIRYTKG